MDAVCFFHGYCWYRPLSQEKRLYLLAEKLRDGLEIPAHLAGAEPAVSPPQSLDEALLLLWGEKHRKMWNPFVVGFMTKPIHENPSKGRGAEGNCCCIPLGGSSPRQPKGLSHYVFNVIKKFCLLGVEREKYLAIVHIALCYIISHQPQYVIINRYHVWKGF